MHRLFNSAIFLFFTFVISCDSFVTEEEIKIPDKDSVIESDKKTDQILSDGLFILTNIEQIEFCVPIPSQEFLRDTINEYERAKYVFKSKLNQKHEIIVQGLNRSDSKVTLDTYFKNSYPDDDEESGKKVETKEIVEGTNCFYAKGYYSNSYWDTRFIEVTWLRSDEVIGLKVFYDVKDTVIWKRRLKQILACDSHCK